MKERTWYCLRCGLSDCNNEAHGNCWSPNPIPMEPFTKEEAAKYLVPPGAIGLINWLALHHRLGRWSYRSFEAYTEVFKEQQDTEDSIVQFYTSTVLDGLLPRWRYAAYLMALNKDAHPDDCEMVRRCGLLKDGKWAHPSIAKHVMSWAKFMEQVIDEEYKEATSRPGKILVMGEPFDINKHYLKGVVDV